MYRTLFVAGILLLSIAGGVYGLSQAQVGYDVRLAIFETGAIKQGLLYIPFKKSLDGNVPISVRIDSDGNGDFTDTERALESSTIRMREGVYIGVPVTMVKYPEVGAQVELKIGDKKIMRSLSRIVREQADLLDLESVRKPEVSMKWGVSVAYAHGFEDFEHHVLITPDFAQGVGECAPTAAANGLISLIREFENARIIDDRKVVADLKEAMKWNRQDGVLDDNFVPGVDAWTRSQNLPIETMRVGDVTGRDTLEMIRRAIDDGAGGAGEVHIKLFNQNSKIVGGHMLSVVAVRYEGEDVYLDVKDPRTPEGIDTYKMNGNILMGYPFDGLAAVSWGYTHRWDSHLAGEVATSTPRE